MFLKSILPILGSFILNALLVALGARPAAALANTWMIKLYTAGPNPITPGTLPAAFTEATFTGYAAIAWVPTTAPINLPTGDGLGIIGPATFVCTTAGTAQSILGYYVEDAANNFIMGEIFAAPVNIVNPGDFVDLQAVFPIANSVPTN